MQLGEEYVLILPKEFAHKWFHLLFFECLLLHFDDHFFLDFNNFLFHLNLFRQVKRLLDFDNGDPFLIKENIGLLLHHSVTLCATHEVIVAIIPLPVEALAIAEVVARSAPTSRVHDYSIQIENLRVT